MEAGELNLHIKRVSSALPGAQSPLPAQGQTTEHQREARRKPLNVAPSQVNVAQWLPASPHFTENVTLCAESLVVTCSLLHNSARAKATFRASPCPIGLGFPEGGGGPSDATAGPCVPCPALIRPLATYAHCCPR